MPRPARIQFSGAWYHVFNRGARHQTVFVDDRDRVTFLSLLGEIEERSGVEVHAYCLMGNHYHLCLHTPQPALAGAMQWLLSRYTQLFNIRHGYDGALFRGRYEAVVVDTDNYLGGLNRYIHRNPLDADITRNLKTYEWSSYRDYLGVRPAPNWLHLEPTQSIIGSDRQLYRGFVEYGGRDEKLDEFYADPRRPFVLGTADFVASLEADPGAGPTRVRHGQ